MLKGFQVEVKTHCTDCFKPCQSTCMASISPTNRPPKSIASQKQILSTFLVKPYWYTTYCISRWFLSKKEEHTNPSLQTPTRRNRPPQASGICRWPPRRSPRCPKTTAGALGASERGSWSMVRARLVLKESKRKKQDTQIVIIFLIKKRR